MALIQDSTDPRFLSQYAGGEMPVVPATPVATNIPVSEIKPTNPLVVPTSDAGLNDFNALMAGTSVSLPQPVSPEESAVKKNQSDILAKMTELGGAGAYQAELESDPILQGNKKDLMDLQSQLMSLNNEAQAAALNVDRQGRPAVLTAAANIEKGNIERDRTIKALRLSSSIQALQGNISLAQDQIDTAIKRKYEPIKAQLDVLNRQLEFNYDTFTTAEKRRADQIKFENDIKMDEINKREDADKRFESLKIQALSNGMSATAAQQAQALYEAGQPEQAYANMSRYTGSKSADVNTSSVVSTMTKDEQAAVNIYSSTVDQAIASGASANEAILAATALADASGTKLSLREQNALLTYARSKENSPASVSVDAPATVAPVTTPSKIEEAISKLKSTGRLQDGDIRTLLRNKNYGFTASEINKSSVGNALTAIESFTDSISSYLFGRK